MRIGDLARHARCDVDTIRYYERAGLMPGPARSTNNYRLYSRAHLERLLFIRHCRALDITQREIRVLLALRETPQASCVEANRILDKHLRDVSARVDQLRWLEQQLKALRQRCPTARKAQRCAILSHLASQISTPL